MRSPRSRANLLAAERHLMRTLLPGVQKAEARYHFLQVVPFGGHPCAQIHITVEAQAQIPGADVPATLQLSGDLYRAIDLKRTVAEEESGPVTFSGTKAVNGVTAHFSGQGTMRVKETHHWLAADGRAVEPARE